MSSASARASLAYSCAGHVYAHIFDPIFFVVALVLPKAMGLPYEDALLLIIGGKVLYGVLAPGAGWLGDRWSATGMMLIFFIGLGLAGIATGLADNPFQLSLGLASLGFFGSIYHPVGTAWLVRNAVNRGKALGVNGIFGGLGAALGGIVAGALTDILSWRAAFIIPGIVVLASGLLFAYSLKKGQVIEIKEDLKPHAAPSKGETIHAGLILTLTMLCTGLIYQVTQPALPKLFEARLGGMLGDGLLGVGGMVTLVYTVAGLFQVVAGHWADRYPLRYVYAGVYLAQVPMLLGAAWIGGLPLLLVVLVMVSMNLAGIPAENSLLARYTPARWRGTAFGMKFVLSFGISGMGVPLMAIILKNTGDFIWVFVLLALMAVIVVAASLMLPRDAPKPAALEEAEAQATA
ncbi:MAG: MFS transporter [Rhodospirillales bacterium]|nr:MFS transporter [Rhodospirillales bacterium]